MCVWLKVDNLTFAKKLLSRKTLAGPANKAYGETFLTLAWRKEWGESCGILMWLKSGWKSIIAIVTFQERDREKRVNKKQWTS